MIQKFNHANKINGGLKLAGDKSISHRAVMFASLADGISEIRNCLLSEDVISTIHAFKKLGCEIDIIDQIVKISGLGFLGLRKPIDSLYLGNSGTTTRLLSGILAAQKFESLLTGDDSLSRRPMNRIIEPLNLMGADITGSRDGTLPLLIRPSKKLKSIQYKMPIASAQVKSSILLLGLHLEDTTEIIEETPTRNHTENMLGLEVVNVDQKKIIRVSRRNYPEPFDLDVPSDISTAAFFIVLGLLADNCELTLYNVLLNETRTGVLQILKEMGGDITLSNIEKLNGEKRGDLIVRSSELKNIKIDKRLIPNIIDEIPILAAAGFFADGEFEIRNAEELRHKESDRIKSICSNFKNNNIPIVEFADGFKIEECKIPPTGKFNSFGDHRIAMTFSIVSMLFKNGGEVNGFECCAVSNPHFIDQINSIVKF
ncbi:MAG: 3-phosphoshikimate 1-carboxyvinyltransferase [Melioribacteraceae bacterium]|nr:3-phosphoshikimate 1-carboxyvinyltransferase [Melioribacteraceae bacterium]MCO6472704.1 3-phosphoshikimate 1-carboxyvinyltransferase [Melioribacteraceae bacterium]MDD3557813.1 3-phosphoshikimate 1-carboxyvinyltransferase [Melioribacteraceae bacterium]